MTITETTVAVGSLRLPVRQAGPAGGEPVVLLHGFPDSLHSWDAQLGALAAAGYRAYAPALRGYAPGAIPADGDYSLPVLVQDLVSLLDALGHDRVHLVGHDWGACIGWLAAAQHPGRLYGYTSLAIPPLGGLLPAVLRVPRQLRNSWYMGFFQLRGIADRRLARDDYAFIERLWHDWSPGWGWPPAAMAEVKDVFRQPGVAQAALGYYRHLFRITSPAARTTLRLLRRPLGVPVLALHGERDGCMDQRLYTPAALRVRAEAGLAVEILPGCGHFLHREHPQAVNALLLDFIGRCRPRG